MFLLRDLLRVLPPNILNVCISVCVSGSSKAVSSSGVLMSVWICMLAVRDHSLVCVERTPKFPHISRALLSGARIKRISVP